MAGKQLKASAKSKKKAPDSPPSTSIPKNMRKSPTKAKSSSPGRNKNRGSAKPLTNANRDSIAAERVRALEEEIKTLKERYKALKTVFFEDNNNMYADRYLKTDNEVKRREVQWTSCVPHQWSDAIDDVFISAENWAGNHINDDPSRLSPQQKSELISRLDGYCVQDELDVIASSLPKIPRDAFLETMVKLLLVKECISRFFTNPFWYLVPNPGTKENPKMDTTGFGAQVFALYENIRAFDPSAAHPWRLWTTRFSNPSDEFGKAMVAQRKRIVDKICEDFLDQDLLKFLLKNSEETGFHDALVHLQKCFNDAAQTSVILASHLKNLELETLNRIGSAYSSDKMKLAHYYDSERREDELEGSRILFIDFPAVYICDGRKDSSCRTLGHPAVVYVEDNDVDDSNSS